MDEEISYKYKLKNSVEEQRIFDTYVGLAFLGVSPARRRAGAILAQEKGSLGALFDSHLFNDEDRASILENHRRRSPDCSGYRYITICDIEYPGYLKTIADPPLGFFVRGRIPDTWPDMVAVVGSRNADREGIKYAREFSESLARYFPVVSGLALGVDGAAHRGALLSRAQFPTIAVIANGIDTISPPSHRALSDEILGSGGVIISEYPPHVAAFPSQFLDRNRIIAGMSRAVVVVQAAQRSGALVTARLGLESGRDIYTLPWTLDNPRGAGCNRLIKEGAGIILSADDLVESLGYHPIMSQENPIQLSREEARIVELLQSEGKLHLEDLKRQLGPSIELTLLQLELSKLIERIPGNFITLGSG